MPQYLSTDPNAGAPLTRPKPTTSGGYLSTDPLAGDPAPNFRASNELDARGRPVVRGDMTERSSGRNLSSLITGAPPDAPSQGLHDYGIGAEKGIQNTIIGLGEMVHRIPGVSRAVDALYGDPGLSARAFAEGRRSTTPSNTGERVGFATEQIGEFFVPGTGAAKLSVAVPKAVAHTYAQSGDATTAGLSGALTAVTPAIVRGAARAAGALREGAQKNVVQALAPTKEWAKTEARRIAPEMLERGVKGSRASMLEQAREQTRAIGQQIGATIDDAAKQGTTIDGLAARGYITQARNTLLTTDAKGNPVPIEGAQAAVRQLDRLTNFVEGLGDDIPIDRAHAVRKTWDRIVSKAGLFGPKATASSTDNAKAWAIREGSGGFRNLLASARPDLAKLNQEYSFWKGLQNVLTETEKRTQSHTGGLIASGTGGAGAIVGAMSGDSMSDRAQNALLGGLAGRQLVKLIQSPAWRTTVTAPMKNMLADALASGQTGPLLSAMGKISAALPSQVTR